MNEEKMKLNAVMLKNYPEVGDIEILNIFDVESRSDWLPFTLGVVVYHIFRMRRFPKARVWDGDQWMQTGLRSHTQLLLNLVREDYDE